jgi:2-methylfumaryl-CoA isomerase
MSGFLAAFALLEAGHHSGLTGDGQLVKLSLGDVGMAVAGRRGLIGEVLRRGTAGRFGNDLDRTRGRDFVTRDGRRVIVLVTRQGRSLGGATGMTGRLSELESRLGLDFRHEGNRWRGRREISELVGPWIAPGDVADAHAAFERHGVLWGPYKTVKKPVAEESRVSTSNPLLVEAKHPGLRRHLATGSPLRLGAAAVVLPEPPPRARPAHRKVLSSSAWSHKE